MTDKPMMKCGHSANATVRDIKTGKTKPCCVICCGITAGWDEIAEGDIDLSGRKAKCCYCDRTVDSNTNLAFFEHKPNEQFDKYYCGCYGWD